MQDCQAYLLYPDSDALASATLLYWSGMCALLPRHRSGPKELLLADHFDDIPHGMSTGYAERLIRKIMRQGGDHDVATPDGPWLH